MDLSKDSICQEPANDEEMEQSTPPRRPMILPQYREYWDGQDAQPNWSFYDCPEIDMSGVSSSPTTDRATHKDVKRRFSEVSSSEEGLSRPIKSGWSGRSDTIGGLHGPLEAHKRAKFDPPASVAHEAVESLSSTPAMLRAARATQFATIEQNERSEPSPHADAPPSQARNSRGPSNGMSTQVNVNASIPSTSPSRRGRPLPLSPMTEPGAMSADDDSDSAIISDASHALLDPTNIQDVMYRILQMNRAQNQRT